MKIKRTNRKVEKLKKRLVPLVLLSLILIGMLYQHLSIYYNASHLGRVGKLIDIDGTSMHLYNAGTGNLPLVFTSDIATNSAYIDFYPIHTLLSKQNKIMIYDKPGYGWSDITSKPRDIDTICKEIHSLLHSEDVPGDEDTFLEPFIYIAKGMGALEAIRYAQLYPEDVAGIVFLEGASPSFMADYNNIMIVESFMINTLRNTGILRLMRHTSTVKNFFNDSPVLTSDIRQLNTGIGLWKVWNRNVLLEKLNVNDNAEIVIEALGENKLGDLPIKVITSKNNIYTNWNSAQRELLNLSTNSSQLIIEGSTNHIEPEDVEPILNEINQFILEVQELREDY